MPDLEEQGWIVDKGHGHPDRYSHPMLDAFGFEPSLYQHNAQAIQSFANRFASDVLRKMIRKNDVFNDAVPLMDAMELEALLLEDMTEAEANAVCRRIMNTDKEADIL